MTGGCRRRKPGGEAGRQSQEAKPGGTADDAPDAGFKIGEAYTGAQGASEGIIGLLDVMKSDFERTI